MPPADRRTTILDAAARLFRHYGHAKTTIADIAREAKVGVGTVYLEFASKEEIAFELSKDVHREVLEAMHTAASRHETAGLETRFVAVMEAKVVCLFKLYAQGEHACDLVTCRNDGKTEAIRTANERFQDDERALLARILETAAPDPRTAAALVQRAYVSLSPPWVFTLERAEATRTARQLAQLLLSGLLPRSVRR